MKPQLQFCIYKVEFLIDKRACIEVYIIRRFDLDFRGTWILSRISSITNVFPKWCQYGHRILVHTFRPAVEPGLVSVQEDSIGPYRASQQRPGQSPRQANFEESDEEDEFDETAAMAPKGDNSRLMRYVEKVKHSKVFQALTDVGFVRHAMENVSETDMQLTVTVERIAGRLALNLPHPPSDKMWWAFVTKPEVKVKAQPKLGDKEVTMERLLAWIEAKMTTEIHRMVTVSVPDKIMNVKEFHRVPSFFYLAWIYRDSSNLWCRKNHTRHKTLISEKLSISLTSRGIC